MRAEGGYGDPKDGWTCHCPRPYVFRKDQDSCPFCLASRPSLVDAELDKFLQERNQHCVSV
jgi:hypothetical protein